MEEKEIKQSVLDELAAQYAEAFDGLASIKNAMTSEIEMISLKYKEKLKTAADNLVAATTALESAIVDSPEVFVKSKTQTLHGIKLGFRKATDELVYNADEETTIELIKSELPKKKKLLIKTEEKLIKTAVKNLSEGELQLIECEIEKNDDVVFIKSADDIIDKFVKQLMAA